MTKYFENFPIITYNGRKVRDITRRNAFKKDMTNNPYLYMPYTVKEGERPEDIANFYYGSTDYTWLVYFSNGILDPHHDWPLSEANFNNYLIEKYAAESGKTGEEVVEWTQQETFTTPAGAVEDFNDNVVYYYREV